MKASHFGRLKSREQARMRIHNRIKRNLCGYFLMTTLLILLFIPSSFLVHAQIEDYPSFVNAPKIWNNTPSDDEFYVIGTDSTVRPILYEGTFFCGLHCSSNRDNCLFAISVFNTSESDLYTSHVVVWSGNRNNPVDFDQARLELTSEGELILKDANDTLVWSTGTAGKSVSTLNLTAEGNLMLLNKTNHILWQSFDHPTDSLVLGQRLVSGQKLRASVSPQNSTEGLYAFVILDHGIEFAAYMEPDPSQIYYKVGFRGAYGYVDFKDDAEFQTGRFGPLDVADSAQFIQFGSDGYLKAYRYSINSEGDDWEGTDLLYEFDIDPCSYPSACGTYGVCLKGGSCNCPDVENKSETPYFRPIDVTNIDLGCDAISPLSCQLSHHHSFIQLPGNYSQRVYNFVFSKTLNVEDCKEACLRNCSCKAVVYREGECQFLSQVVSIMKTDSPGVTDNVLASNNYSNSAFIKVQNQNASIPPSSNFSPRKKQSRLVIFGSTLAAIIGGVFLICLVTLLKSKKRSHGIEEDYLDNMLGMPTRFSYEELRNATNNFSNKLGEGGFGSVFHGILPSCSDVAVKHLVGFGPVNKSFLAEVQTIGSIHHRNLVTLVGFCAEKLERLLVYEYMANGSLDGWIFNKNHDTSLGWQVRKKIILDIAKGLAYLHEECNQKIIHLDIKPQNILVDENFNAKVSDFGLSKLIGKDQSRVFTGMKGTPGYMAPEWLSSSITEKVDVYSFGIVVLQILCGRRNFEEYEEEEYRHVLGVFRRKQEEGRLIDLVDKCNEDMQSNAVEVVEMMKVAAWCLQSEYARRPSMSTVVKLIEVSADVAVNMNEVNVNGRSDLEAMERSGSTVLPSMLSGPR